MALAFVVMFILNARIVGSCGGGCHWLEQEKFSYTMVGFDGLEDAHNGRIRPLGMSEAM